jgi:glycosyltransferase involved in cell wall biosynthesis
VKIVLLSDWFLPRLGGVELQLRDLAGQLAARGHRVDVVTTTPADPRAQGALQTGAVGVPDGVTVHRIDVPLLPGLHVTYTPSIAGVAMREALERIAPDVVHAHASIGSTGALAGGWAAHSLDLPTIVTFHSVLGPYRHLLRAFDAALGWTRWPSVFSAVSRALAKEVEWLARGRAVEVLPNGLDPAEWATPHAVGARDELRLVAVQRLQARKRGLALIEVVAAASRRLEGRRRVTLTVIGEGPQRAKMEALARRRGIGDRVEFTGYLARAEIKARFARADAFVLVSVLESFGIAALEARAAGLPVIARRETGMAELLEHAGKGCSPARTPGSSRASSGSGPSRGSSRAWPRTTAKRRPPSAGRRRSRSISRCTSAWPRRASRRDRGRPFPHRSEARAPLAEQPEHLAHRGERARSRSRATVPPQPLAPQVHQLPRDG